MTRKYYLYIGGATPTKFYDTLEEAKKEVEEIEKSSDNIYGNIFMHYKEELENNNKIYKKLKWREVKNRKKESRYVLSYQSFCNYTCSRKKQICASFCIKYIDFPIDE